MDAEESGQIESLGDSALSTPMQPAGTEFSQGQDRALSIQATPSTTTAEGEKLQAAPSQASPATSEKPKVFCPKCGNAAEVGTPFCPQCGTSLKRDEPVDVKAAGESTVHAQAMTATKKKKRTGLVAGIVAAIIVVAAAVFCVAVLPGILVTPEELMQEGKFQEAFDKASGDEKEAVAVANLLCVLSYDESARLKDPSSFVLREAYFDDAKHRIVLYSGGTNSYGGMVNGYDFYWFDEDDDEYSYVTSVSSLSEESINRWDTSSEKTEKYIENYVRGEVKDIISVKKYEIPDETVELVNSLFESGDLKSVQLVEGIGLIYPDGKGDAS